MNTKHLTNPRNHRHSGALPETLKSEVKEVESYRYKITVENYQSKAYTVYHSKLEDMDGNLLRCESEWEVLD